MKSCKRCGSYAINEHAHGRVKGRHADLCDVCYWRNNAEILEHALSFVIPNCQWLHHEKEHFHAADEPCPVEAIINKAKDMV